MAEQFGVIQEIDASEEDSCFAQHDAVTTIGDNDLNDISQMDEQNGTVPNIEEPFIHHLIDTPDTNSKVTIDDW